MWDNILGGLLFLLAVSFVVLICVSISHEDTYRGFDHIRRRISCIRSRKFRDNRIKCFRGAGAGDIKCEYCFDREKCWDECWNVVKAELDKEIERRKAHGRKTDERAEGGACPGDNTLPGC